MTASGNGSPRSKAAMLARVLSAMAARSIRRMLGLAGDSQNSRRVRAVMAAATYAQSNECSCRHCTQMMKVCDDFSKLASAVMERAISEETSH